MFIKVKLYVKLYHNKITVIDLLNGTEFSKNATISFSIRRAIVAKFDAADILLKETLRENGYLNSIFLKTISIVIQQMVVFEEGLTDIELRAMRDLAEQAGAKNVVVVEHAQELSISEALSLLN